VREIRRDAKSGDRNPVTPIAASSIAHLPELLRLTDFSSLCTIDIRQGPADMGRNIPHDPQNSPEKVGSAPASFVAKVLAGQIR
jgi:hypothetical protein